MLHVVLLSSCKKQSSFSIWLLYISFISHRRKTSYSCIMACCFGFWDLFLFTQNCAGLRCLISNIELFIFFVPLYQRESYNNKYCFVFTSFRLFVFTAHARTIVLPVRDQSACRRRSCSCGRYCSIVDPPGCPWRGRGSPRPVHRPSTYGP